MSPARLIGDNQTNTGNFKFKGAFRNNEQKFDWTNNIMKKMQFIIKEMLHLSLQVFEGLHPELLIRNSKLPKK